MPELPEIETIRLSLTKSIIDIPITAATINHPNLHLRCPIPHQLETALLHCAFSQITRRGKYLLLHTIASDINSTNNKNSSKISNNKTNKGVLLIHLGMSGKLLLLPQSTPIFKHEHLTITFANHLTLRFIDPRRFGAILWIDGSSNPCPLHHPALKNLGVEPLTNSFTANYLYNICQHRKITIKQLIMDNKIVVGIGNIYACEALFLSGIKPSRSAYSLSIQECQKLVSAIKQILHDAIKHGGTTIRDFVSSDGVTGKFAQQLQIYGRAQQPCFKCGAPLKFSRLNQRSTVYCENCQK